MAARNLEKMASIDAQLRLLAPGKVSEDDKLVEYDALLLDRFLDILQDLHGEEIRETVRSSASFSEVLVFSVVSVIGIRIYSENLSLDYWNSTGNVKALVLD